MRFLGMIDCNFTNSVKTAAVGCPGCPFFYHPRTSMNQWIGDATHAWLVTRQAYFFGGFPAIFGAENASFAGGFHGISFEEVSFSEATTLRSLSGHLPPEVCEHFGDRLIAE